MKLTWKKTIWISLLGCVLLILPLSTAWGFDKGSEGADAFSVHGMPASLGDLNRTLTGTYVTPVPSTYPITGLTAEEEQMIQLINQARAQAGLQALIVDAALTQTARLKSQDMVSLNYFAHESPTYGSPYDMMGQFGISFQSAGENIACSQTVAAAEEALMNSQSQRDNILNAGFTSIGIGIIKGGKCGQMYTQQFVGR
jgi:uncharacterized YkwD family protein